METEPDEEQKVQPEIEEENLSNCWKTPPRSVYSRFLTGQSHSSTTHASTLSGITDSNTSPDGATMQPSLEKAVQDQKAEWEKETKARAKERDEAQRNISGALEKLHEATAKCSQDQESA
eukprot:7111535-Ditylum_brightwellii.AAC.1